jgi:hypothetical protein
MLLFFWLRVLLTMTATTSSELPRYSPQPLLPWQMLQLLSGWLTAEADIWVLHVMPHGWARQSREGLVEMMLDAYTTVAWRWL